MRDIHISTKLQLKGKPLPVDHGESEVIQRHLSVSDKDIRLAVSAQISKNIRINSANIRFDAGAGYQTDILLDMDKYLEQDE